MPDEHPLAPLAAWADRLTPAIPAEVLAPVPPLTEAAMRLAMGVESGDVVTTDGQPAERPEPWTPQDAGAAEWAMAQLGAVWRQLDGIARQADLWRQQIDRWAAEAQADPARRAEFFDAALARYAEQRLAADPKVRTVKLPSGDVAITVPKSGTVHIADEDAVIVWADASGHEAVVKRPPPPEPKAMVSELRRVAKAVEQEDGTWVVIDPATGEPVPGAVATPPAPPTIVTRPGWAAL